jgi:tetratricopeptide (TPR) repeat protein
MSDVSNRSGGTDINSQSTSVGGNVVGRDNIESHTMNYYGTTPPQPRRAELPHQPYFFGREEELAIIAEALDPESNGWGVLIDGPGGIGKTALAIRAGHLAPDSVYPTKILLSAKGSELTPRGDTPLDDFKLPNYQSLLAELARELGGEGIERLAPDERTREVRRLLENSHALIIVDNLETFDEKERERLYQFLKRLPRSCKAIVTSRRRTDVAAEIIRLDCLSPEASQKLISKLAEHNEHLAHATEDDRGELYVSTEGNPLLIEWVVGQLGRDGSHCSTVSEACQYLNSAPSDNDPLEYIFGDLLDTFPENETRVLVALTHFTLLAKAEWIATIANIARPAAKIALRDLSARALLNCDVEGERYILLPLVARFLRRKRPEAVKQTGDRLANYVYALVHEQEAREDYARFPELEAEWPNISAALRQFLQSNLKRLKEISYSLGTFLGANGHWDERLWLSLETEKLTVAANDFVGAGWQAYNAGVVYFRRGQVVKLRDCIRRVDEYWAVADAREKAYGLRLHGWLHRLEKEYPEAIASYEQALALVRVGSPERLDVVFMLNSLGHVKRDSGDYDAAERDYREALELARQDRYRLQIAESTGNLAEIALARHAWSQAENLAREALVGTEAVGHQDFTARNCLCLAHALVGQDRRDEGLPHAQHAVEIFTKLRSPSLAGAQVVLIECGG